MSRSSSERLQEMLDYYEIRRTISEYCNGCDRLDEQRMGSVYADDSFDDHGTVKAPGPEFATTMAASVAQSSHSIVHLLGQTLIDVRGDEAGAETYFLATSRTMTDEGEIANQLSGRFVDTLVRVGDGWKIKYRLVVRDWTAVTPVTQNWDAAMSLTAGTRSNDDPSFRVLGRTHSGPPTLLAEAP
jgi:hypothetical protein